MQDDKGGMGNSLCKVPLQGVCPTNEGYTTEQPRGSFDHCKHKDELCNELCTLNIVHDSHAYNQQKGGCYVKFCPDTLHNYLCPQPEVNALSMFFFTHTSHKLCTCCFRMSEEDSRTHQEYPTKTLNLQASLLKIYNNF